MVLRSCGSDGSIWNLRTRSRSGSAEAIPLSWAFHARLEAGLPELQGRVADDAGQRVRGIDPVRLAVLVALVPGEQDAVAIGDLAAQHVARGGDDRRVVAASG